MAESKSSPRRVIAKERRRKALELRKAGVTFQASADTVGFRSAQAAYDSVDRALRQFARPPAEQLRELEIRRLDAMLQVVWPFVIAPTVKTVPMGQQVAMQVWDEAKFLAIDRCLRILAQRARLLGLEVSSESPFGNQPLLPGQREVTMRVIYDSPLLSELPALPELGTSPNGAV